MKKENKDMIIFELIILFFKNLADNRYKLTEEENLIPYRPLHFLKTFYEFLQTKNKNGQDIYKTFEGILNTEDIEELLVELDWLVRMESYSEAIEFYLREFRINYLSGEPNLIPCENGYRLDEFTQSYEKYEKQGFETSEPVLGHLKAIAKKMFDYYLNLCKK